MTKQDIIRTAEQIQRIFQRVYGMEVVIATPELQDPYADFDKASIHIQKTKDKDYVYAYVCFHESSEDVYYRDFNILEININKPLKRGQRSKNSIRDYIQKNFIHRPIEYRIET